MANSRVVNLKQETQTEDRPATEAEKILDLNALAQRVARSRKQGQRVVLCHGTFDLLHVGHVKHLQAARREGDVLVVTVTADAFVNKGPGRPVFTQHLRAENLAALQCVDYVAVNAALTSVNVLETLRPDVYVKGDEYQCEQDDITGNIRRERDAVEKYGGRIHYTQEPAHSSSHLLNQHFPCFTDEVKIFLDDFRQQHHTVDLNASLASLAELKVCVLGDAIIDEYHYTESLGQTGKGNVLAVRYKNAERFAGGAIAVANHVAGFAGEVTLVTGLGGQSDSQSHEDFIRSKLPDNVTPVFFSNPDTGTLVKRRYIGEDMLKLFEVYVGDEELITAALSEQLCAWLQSHLEQFDAVIVPDFGNGFITQQMASVLSDKARFLAVNTQVNSGNRGYHLVTRYPRADFVSLNEPELRMAAGDRHGEISALATEMATRMSAQFLAVTRGIHGVLMVDDQSQVPVPALSTHVVDRIGAGDAFLSMAGLSLASGLSAEVAAFFGSIAGALNVQSVCNREPLDPILFRKYLTTLLK